MSFPRSKSTPLSLADSVDSDTEVLPSCPSPAPTPVSEECYRSSHAVYVYLSLYLKAVSRVLEVGVQEPLKQQ